MPSDSSSSRDHPRVGGEKLTSLTVKALSPGSPPHGRGKVDVLPEVDPLIGITPAWAGKRVNIPSIASLGWDHPRMGGEKHGVPVSWMWSAGSPPHGRGKETADKVHHDGARITPAWAGKSASCTYAAQRPRDHPRMGGEKLVKKPPLWFC